MTTHVFAIALVTGATALVVWSFWRYLIGGK
jgi:hypothetical protein